MNILVKQVLNEPFKSRHNCNIPIVDGDTISYIKGNWGNFPCDIRITQGVQGYNDLISLKNSLPLSKIISYEWLNSYYGPIYTSKDYSDLEKYEEGIYVDCYKDKLLTKKLGVAKLIYLKLENCIPYEAKLVCEVEDGVSYTFYYNAEKGCIENYAIRYRNLINAQTFLNNFIENSAIYRKCRRIDKYTNIANDVWVKVTDKKIFEIKDEIKNISSTLPYVSEYTCGDYVCINDNAEEFLRTFNEVKIIDKYDLSSMSTNIIYKVLSKDNYYVYDGNICHLLNDLTTDIANTLAEKALNNAFLFQKFSNNYLTKEEFSEEELSQPYFSVPLVLEEEYNENGIYSVDIDYWIPNKKYYLNDCVFYSYNGNEVSPYILKKGENIDEEEMPSYLQSFYEEEYNKYKNDNCSNYIFIEEDYSSMEKEIKEDKKHQYILIKDSKYYNLRPYFKGNYDSGNTKITWFDNWSIDAEGNLIINLEHWERADDTDVISSQLSGVTGNVDSQLVSLKRLRQSRDDNSNLLPFIVKEVVSGGTISVSQYGEIPFLIHTPINCEVVVDSKGETKIYGDVIDSIRILSKDSTGYPTTLVCTGTTVTSENKPSSGVIEFTYYLTCELHEDEESEYVKPLYGIKYIDKYDYKKDTLKCQYNGTEIEFEYLKINYNSIQSSAFYYSKEQGDDDDFITEKAHAFKKEYLMDVENYSIDTKDMKIQRGTSSAFERHNILNELNSFDDLLKYRNDYFNISNDENK